MKIKKIVAFMLVVFLGVSGIVCAGDVSVSGYTDIQYRAGESYKDSGQDAFDVSALRLKFKAGLGGDVDGLVVVDGADLTKDSVFASHEYIEEAQIIINKKGSPFTFIFGKDEMPYGQDYDTMLFNPLVHSLEIDKVWGLNTGCKFSDAFKVEVGIWEQNGINDISIYENITMRATLAPIKNMTIKASAAVIEKDGGKDEQRFSFGSVYKITNFVFHAEYNSLQNTIAKLGGYSFIDDPTLVSFGSDWKLSKKWKVKARVEWLDDDTKIETIVGAVNIGLDCKIGDNTSLMYEYQNLVGEDEVKDKSDVSVGIIAKF